ncbi:MAG: CRTAC1 family protein, partial [Flavobacteriales bacterium]|nr:CRTAC1 family protein [Flavobacteriales bacterium]
MRLFFPLFFILSICSSGEIYGQSASFSEVSLSSGIDHRAIITDTMFAAQGGVAWFDYNMDGFEDLYLTGGGASDVLFENDGNGGFINVTNTAGLSVMDGSVKTMGVISGDIDNDGYRELFITTEDANTNYLFYNNGDGTFTDISVSAGVNDGGNSASAAFGDYDLDGDLDLYVTNWCVEMLDMTVVDTFPTVQNYLYRNNGDLTFTEVSASMGVSDATGCSLGVMFTDFDNDRDLDLMIANDFGFLAGNNENSLFRCEFPATGFVDISEQAIVDFGINGMGTAHGDYDEDGDLDYYISNIGNDLLLRNDGNSFSNQLINAGLENDTVLMLDRSGYENGYGWSSGFFDFDNDTDLDLFVANGGIAFQGVAHPNLDTNKLFSNNGDGTFTDVSVLEGVADTYISRGFAHCDYDNDGDIDMLVGISDSEVGNQHSLLYKNNLPSGNWLKVSLIGVAANRDGFGARVSVKFNGRTLIREVDGGSGFNSHHSSIVHFGLANVTMLDTVTV